MVPLLNAPEIAQTFDYVWAFSLSKTPPPQTQVNIMTIVTLSNVTTDDKAAFQVDLDIDDIIQACKDAGIKPSNVRFMTKHQPFRIQKIFTNSNDYEEAVDFINDMGERIV